jgi:hypothetical protein
MKYRIRRRFASLSFLFLGIITLVLAAILLVVTEHMLAACAFFVSTMAMFLLAGNADKHLRKRLGVKKNDVLRRYIFRK